MTDPRMQGALLSVWAAVAMVGCRPSDSVASRLMPPARDVALEGQTKCGVRRNGVRPLVVDWPAADRVALEASLPDGAVVVRYDGCELEVLPRCRVPEAHYGYRGVTLKAERVAIASADELYAQMPVGAAKLEAALERSGALSVSLSTVGIYELDAREVSVSRLEGRCDGATHVVQAVAVGAYELLAGQAAVLAAGASVRGGVAEVGASSSAERSVLSRDGDVSACELASTEDGIPMPGCGAPLRLELAELTGQRPCPSGYELTGELACASEGAAASTGSRRANRRSEAREATVVAALSHGLMKMVRGCQAGQWETCEELGFSFYRREPIASAHFFGRACDVAIDPHAHNACSFAGHGYGELAEERGHPPDPRIEGWLAKAKRLKEMRKQEAPRRCEEGDGPECLWLARELDDVPTSLRYYRLACTRANSTDDTECETFRRECRNHPDDASCGAAVRR